MADVITAPAANDESAAVDLLASLRARLVEQQAADAARPVSAPFVCGDRRLAGQHYYQPHGLATYEGQPLRCTCGARARIGHEGQLFAEYGLGKPPADPVAAATEAA